MFDFFHAQAGASQKQLTPEVKREGPKVLWSIRPIVLIQEFIELREEGM